MQEQEKELKLLSLSELRARWAVVWGIKPHAYIGRRMLERSLTYKIKEQQGHSLTLEQRQRLNKLVRAYKRNPDYFDQGHAVLKFGTRLVRNWQGKAHTVTVTETGFLYQDIEYSSLSTIANNITRSRWNGRLFFGLNKLK